jgi:hypothetical protein
MQIGMLPGDFDVFIKELSGTFDEHCVFVNVFHSRVFLQTAVTKGDFTFDIDGGAQPAVAGEAKEPGKGKKGKGKK